MFAFSEAAPTPVSGQDKTTRPPLDIRLVTDDSGMRQLVEWLATQDEVGLDCEATGKDPVAATPLLLQVGNSETVWVVVLPKQFPSFIAEVMRAINRTTVVGHNLNYDYKLLRSHYPDCVEWTSIYDTQVAEAMLTAGDFANKSLWLKEGLALKVLVQKYLGEKMAKEERLTFTEIPPEKIPNWEPTPEQVQYAALDVADTVRVANKQVDDLANEGMLVAAQTRFKAVVPIANVELRGMKIDVDAWRAFLAQVAIEKAAVETQLIAKLDRYEQKHRLKEFQEQTHALQLWEQAYAAEQERLKALWDHTPITTSLPVPASCSETALPPSPDGPKDPSSSCASLEPPGTPMPPAQWDKSPPSPSTATASSTTASPAPSPSWGKWKTEQLQKWRALHPRPKKPNYDATPINLNSPAQLKRAYSALGLKLEKADKETRATLLRSASLSPAAREVLTLHNEHSRLSRLLSGFGENILKRLSSTGRLHTSYNIGLTDTGRMSSERPNFQNFPQRNELRHCFVADPGYVVVTADFKSQELAISAALSGDPQMCEDIRLGRDLYKQLAVTVYGLKDETEVTSDQRKVCKSGLLGIAYGLTPVGMEAKNNIPREIGTKVIDAIKTRYPQMFTWLESNASLAVSRGYTLTALGAKRYFRDPTAEMWQVQNQGRNQPVQGTAADIVYTVARRLEDNVVPFGVLPVNFVHDEVVALVPADWAEEGETLIVSEMKAAFNEVLPFEHYGVVCGVDVHRGPWWTKE